MIDRIELNKIQALGTIGVLPEEKNRAQPFEIDLAIETDLSVAGASDDLDDTIIMVKSLNWLQALFRTNLINFSKK